MHPERTSCDVVRIALLVAGYATRPSMPRVSRRTRRACPGAHDLRREKRQIQRQMWLEEAARVRAATELRRAHLAKEQKRLLEEAAREYGGRTT